ncbi:MAG: hypothetical protein U5R30_15225 [Deltaproteobacteria bacterium]|nr:hypothetical protein [Deltaproteobacteria bacterium]
MKWKAIYRRLSALGFLAATIFIIEIAVCPSNGYGADIVDAEYFIDTDPGEGNGEQIPPADGAFNSSEESVDFSGIDLAGLKIGNHTLYLRFKSADESGVWRAR